VPWLRTAPPPLPADPPLATVRFLRMSIAPESTVKRLKVKLLPLILRNGAFMPLILTLFVLAIAGSVEESWMVDEEGREKTMPLLPVAALAALVASRKVHLVGVHAPSLSSAVELTVKVLSAAWALASSVTLVPWGLVLVLWGF
jgi:hypothetical protein